MDDARRAGPTDRAGDGRGDRADAVARHRRGRAAEAREPGLERLAGLYILIPPFVSQAGALGGILSSRLSSKLQLGVITPRGRPERPAVLDASIVVALGAVIFTLIGVVGLGLADLFGHGAPLGRA